MDSPHFVQRHTEHNQLRFRLNFNGPTKLNQVQVTVFFFKESYMHVVHIPQSRFVLSKSLKGMAETSTYS